MSDSTCKRCGQPFQPEFLDALKRFSTCCMDCMYRNLTDACNLPMPPEMLDPHTKNPTLSEDEFRKKLNEQADRKRKRKRK